MRLLLLALALALFSPAPPAVALEPGEMFADPELEARARELGRQLRCVKCRNQSIFDSNAGIAKDLRVLVRERMELGDSDAEVLAFVQERYGDYVLLKPRVSAETYVLWLAPVAMILVAGAGFAAYMRSRPGAGAAAALSSADRAAAQALLRGKDG